MCRGILGVPKAQGLELSPATSLGKPATMPRKQTTHLEVTGSYDQPQLSSECPEDPKSKNPFANTDQASEGPVYSPGPRHPPWTRLSPQVFPGLSTTASCVPIAPHTSVSAFSPWER